MGIKLWRVQKRRRPKAKPTTIGKLGEEMVRALLPSLSASQKALDAGAGVREVKPEKFGELVRLVQSLKKSVEKVCEGVLGKPLADAGPYLLNIVKGDLVGLFKIASRLSEEFGELKMVGKGDLRSIMQPSSAVPDVVFATRRGSILVAEVKNSERHDISDQFQATFYNTTAKLGALVLGKRVDKGIVKLLPETLPEEKISTVLLYQRQGEVEKISKIFELKKILRDVWRVKQLGMMGKQPESPKIEYCKKCVWKRVCSNWSKNVPLEGEHEPATPLALITAKGLLETGFDIETHVLYDLIGDYIWKIENFVERQIINRYDRLQNLSFKLDNIANRYRAESGKSFRELDELNRIIDETIDRLHRLERKKIVEQVASIFGLSIRKASALLYSPPPTKEHTLDATYRAVVREISSELQPWKRILKKEELERLMSFRLISGVTRFIPPARSRYFINEAWRFWH
ncbi:MAG: hypothetical protein QXU44_02455 [Candidatus Caldarchaeum sp.]